MKINGYNAYDIGDYVHQYLVTPETTGLNESTRVYRFQWYSASGRGFILYSKFSRKPFNFVSWVHL